MEARSRSRVVSLGIILAAVLLIRLPFLNQAIGGDDPYYIFGAQHALLDPAHPSHTRYIFHGELVDMRGHSHPPLNSWILAGLIAVVGDVREVPFHAAYIAFSLIAALSMYVLASRWSRQPLLATLLFIASPAFVINGNSLESDVPFLAWWMAGFAAFVCGRYALAGLTLTLAAMTAYQATVATPVLWVFCWLHARRSKAAWVVACTPVIVVACYQLYERLTGGTLPATVLAGYFSSYGLQQLSNKLRNAAALTAHSGWLVFPVAAIAAFRSRWLIALAAAVAGAFIDPHPLFWASFGAGAAVISGCVSRRPGWLECWVLLFFAAALVLFFAGSARYLLPMAAPVVLLVAARLSVPWLGVAAGANLALGLALAFVNYQHWDAYRAFIGNIPDAFAGGTSKTWINGELGIRFYAESAGAIPVARDQSLFQGEWVISSELGFPIPLTAPLALNTEREIRPSLPLRLIGTGARSGYSSASFGLRPFDIHTGPVDTVRTHIVRPRVAVRSWLPMNAPEADQQILSGIYQLEGATRWMGKRAVLLLARPAVPQPIEVQIYLPSQASARGVRVLVDGEELSRDKLSGEGLHTIRTAAVSGSVVTIELDQTFRVAGDNRDLGAVLVAAGYR